MQIVIEIDERGDLGVWWSEEAGKIVHEVAGDGVGPTQEFILAPDPHVRENGLCG